MLLILLAALLTQTPSLATAEEAAAETAALDILARTEAERRCTELGRMPGESIDACTDRRMALRANGYTVNDPHPFTVTAMRRRCQDGSRVADETLTACIVRIINQPASSGSSELRIETAAAPRPDPAPETEERCRRETLSEPERGRASVTWTCGDPDSAAAAEAMLDSLLP